jgi:LDH2 family malate/lactate/ureidoglycolate dehydrogenase
VTPHTRSPEDALRRLRTLGFSEPDAATLAAHFLDAERRGKPSHGLVRIEWLATLPELSPAARPERVVAEPGFERWEGRGALGYLTMAAICDTQLASPPDRARLVVAADAWPVGMLGHWVRRLAEGGLLALMTATSPARLSSPEGGPPLAGTTPLAVAVPSSDGRPVVADVSMAKATHGHVLLGTAGEDDIVPFGGDQAHKTFALALGLHAFVDALTADGSDGAVLLVARPWADPVPALRARAGDVHIPGDR